MVGCEEAMVDSGLLSVGPGTEEGCSGNTSMSTARLRTPDALDG